MAHLCNILPTGCKILLLTLVFLFPTLQGSCGFARSAGPPCAASVCLEKMAAHYKEAHGAIERDTLVDADVLGDGSKRVLLTLNYSFPKIGDGWFIYDGFTNNIFKPVFGGCFNLEIRKFGANELRFGVRQLGRGPPRHRLASVKVRFGHEAGAHFQYILPRALTAEERLADDALSAGRPPAVARVDPDLLATAMVLSSALPPPKDPWDLELSTTLVFEVVEDANPAA